MLVRILLIVIGLVVLVPLAGWLYYTQLANPRVARELVADPDGERARKVMLLMLPSGREIPVNYLREGDKVFAGADGRWWRELEGGGGDVQVLVRGVAYPGRARAVRDDPEYTRRVFARLRPNAVEGFGTLIEVQLMDPLPSGGVPDE